MLKWLAGLASCLLISCGGSGGGNPNPGPPHPVAKSLIGYGLVNYWDQVDPHAFAKQLHDSGLNFTEISWAPWHGVPNDPCGSNSTAYPDKAIAFINAMEVEDITVLVETSNGNNCAQMKQGDGYITGEIATLVANTPNVIITTVAEPWASPTVGLRWSTLIAGAWSGLLVQPDKGANHYTGKSYYPSLPADFLDVHFCNPREISPTIAIGSMMVIVNTDCSPILNPGPELAAEWAHEAQMTGANLMIYDFHNQVPDLVTIQAMGAAL